MKYNNHKLNKKIEEVQYIKLGVFKHLFGKFKNHLFENIHKNILFTGTGRASLRIILQYYAKNKIINNRNSQILIPHWICQSVIHTMNRFCSPTLTINKNLKGIMAYHQYGFPQKIDEISDYCEDKGIFLIEDCANTYESYYKNKHLGTFGDASIFSISKLFPSILGGALITGDNELYKYGKEKILKCNKNISHLTYSSRLLFECLKDTSLNNFVKSMQEMIHTKIDSSLNIKNISLRIANRQLLNGAMEQRKKNHQFIIEYFDNRPEYFNRIEQERVIPYVVPLFDKEENLKKMVKRLKSKNVITNIYHFDINRNILQPNFKKCIWMPIHQGINEHILELICKTIKNI